ncbi:MAG: hypothetical protein JW995_03950 [Melioribacteraceae bacterium]|nr:hypothetical protein [Melioribacteraceae bacterium]
MKNFRINLIIRILLISFTILLLVYLLNNTRLTATISIIFVITILQIYSLIKYVDYTNRELTKFFLSIKHSDFSQTFSDKKMGKSFRELADAFNEVINSFKKTRSEKEENYKYLLTVMQHVGVGLISYNSEGNVEFMNNSAKKLLRINNLTNIKQLDKISDGLSRKILDSQITGRTDIRIIDENDIHQIVAYSTMFRMREQTYTLLALQNIQSELEDKEMEAWQKLIRVLTHEIMNSITPISSLAGTINDILNNSHLPDKSTIEDIRNAVLTIGKRSDGLLHFVENYRNLAKIQKPKFELFPVKNLFLRIQNLLSESFEKANISLSMSVEPESLELTADQEMIEQSIINILVNAKQALINTPDAQVLVICFPDQIGRTTIRIIDNGPGISEEVQEKIFIPFFSTKKDGSGIGLSLARQIVRANNGTIRVNSVVNEGTAFTIKF